MTMVLYTYQGSLVDEYLEEPSYDPVAHSIYRRYMALV